MIWRWPDNGDEGCDLVTKKQNIMMRWWFFAQWIFLQMLVRTREQKMWIKYNNFVADYDDEEFICNDHNEHLQIANIKISICTLPTVRTLLKTKKQISLFSHPVWSLRGGVSHPHTSDSWWWSTRCWWPLFLLLTFINDHISHERWMAIIQWIFEMQTKNRQIKWHLK